MAVENRAARPPVGDPPAMQLLSIGSEEPDVLRRQPVSLRAPDTVREASRSERVSALQAVAQNVPRARAEHRRQRGQRVGKSAFSRSRHTNRFPVRPNSPRRRAIPLRQ